jgi:histidine ammonia-lyase
MRKPTMSNRWAKQARSILGALALATAAAAPMAAHAQFAFGDAAGYRPITASMADKTVVLTGKTMTVDQLMDISRRGAKVAWSPAAKQQMADNYGLLLQAPLEGVSVYWFTRGAGGNREQVIFTGDPLRPDNRDLLEKRMLAAFQRGVGSGDAPEILDEALVRGVMAVRANAVVWNAPSPQLAQALIDLLNKGVTPIMNSRGSVGEGDLSILNQIGATMVGAGEAYYQGKRMPAAQALQMAGLKPIQPFAADDNALTSSNAYFTAMAAFVVADAKQALEWTDLTYAIDLVAMNSSVTPLSHLVQTDRPFKWLNWNAVRIRDMIRGSYLFGDDKGRIIQDPESLRASSIRSGSAWQAWATLRDDVTTQLNSSDHNPAIRTDIKPSDSWDLNTPEALKYYVKGGKNSNGKGGFIFSNANWDPYPVANDIEFLTIALANSAVTVMTRQERFGSEFFTGPGTAEIARRIGGPRGGGFGLHEAYQDLQGQINPVPPEGYIGGGGVEELEAQTKLKAERAMRAVDDMFRLLAGDLNMGMRWLDVRKVQDPTRQFGPAPTAVWTAYRKVNPVPAPGATTAPAPMMSATEFMRANPASNFFPLTEPR